MPSSHGYTVKYPTSDSFFLMETWAFSRVFLYTKKNQVARGMFTVYHERCITISCHSTWRRKIWKLYITYSQVKFEESQMIDNLWITKVRIHLCLLYLYPEERQTDRQTERQTDRQADSCRMFLTEFHLGLLLRSTWSVDPFQSSHI